LEQKKPDKSYYKLDVCGFYSAMSVGQITI